MAKKKPRKRSAKKRPTTAAGSLAAAVSELREGLSRLREEENLGVDLVGDLRHADRLLAPVRDVIAEHLRAILRAAHVERRPPLEKGRKIAREVNDMLASYGLRLRFPGTKVPATLAYMTIGTAKPAAFVLRAHGSGKAKVHYLATDFSELDIIVAPPDLRRRRKQSRQK